MKIVGIICEYNPFHLGHKKQFDRIREAYGSDCIIVCLMSGNFVQRGMPAIFDKELRARCALQSGADLVLELPLPYALSSAEGFAACGVKILSGFCDALCFGTETGTKETLLQTAAALLSAEFSTALKEQLSTGISFPAARQAAMEAMGADSSLLQNPNDILAVEYCKAILSQGSVMDIHPIHRGGSYHATTADVENPSATALRQCIENGLPWQQFVPESTHEILRDAAIYTIDAGQRAILARLRSMTEADFAQLPYGSEGLWRKLMHACRCAATLEEIRTAVKSKRYTRTRLDRMVMCAFLGITQTMLSSPVPYVRVLALNDRGRAVLKKARENLHEYKGESLLLTWLYRRLQKYILTHYEMPHDGLPARERILTNKE